MAEAPQNQPIQGRISRALLHRKALIEARHRRLELCASVNHTPTKNSDSDPKEECCCVHGSGVATLKGWVWVLSGGSRRIVVGMKLTDGYLVGKLKLDWRVARRYGLAKLEGQRMSVCWICYTLNVHSIGVNSLHTQANLELEISPATVVVFPAPTKPALYLICKSVP